MRKDVFIIFQQLNKEKKMALKFNIEDFLELDTPDLLINIWSYSNCLNEKGYDKICDIYRKYCIIIVKGRWRKGWGNFNEIMSDIKNNYGDFIDLSQYSSANKHKIIRDLTKIEQKRTGQLGLIY